MLHKTELFFLFSMVSVFLALAIYTSYELADSHDVVLTVVQQIQH